MSMFGETQDQLDEAREKIERLERDARGLAENKMRLDVTWPRTTPVSAAEQLLRDIFEYLGIDKSNAEIAALQTMVERYKHSG